MTINVLYIHSSADMYGSDRSLLRLLAHRDAQRISPVVCLPYRGPLAREIEALGVTVHVTDMGVVRRHQLDPFGVIELIWGALSGTRAIYRIIKEEEVDIVHTNTSAVFSGAFAARLARVPHVWHVREMYGLGRITGGLYAAVIDLCADRIVCVSNAVKNHLTGFRRRCAPKCAIIHNGIDLPAYGREGDSGALRDELGIPRGRGCIGAVGRINRVKGHELFLEVAARIREKYPQAFFAIAGDVFSLKGRAREKWRLDALREQIRKAGLDRDVRVLGFLPQIEKLYGVLDLYLFTSVLPDSFPTTVIEAMAAGVPVVASDIGGVRDIITDGENGLLVRPGDADGFVAAVGRLLSDDTLRQRVIEKGREACRERFTVEMHVRAVEKIYQELAGT